MQLFLKADVSEFHLRIFAIHFVRLFDCNRETGAVQVIVKRQLFKMDRIIIERKFSKENLKIDCHRFYSTAKPHVSSTACVSLS